MKTPAQIRAWLESREWWPQFVKNTVEFDYRAGRAVFLAGQGRGVPSMGFQWKRQ